MSKPKKDQFTIHQCYLTMFEDYPDIVTAPEVAEMMRLPVKRIYRMFRSGEIKCFKDERDIRTCKLWVIEYIQRYGFIRQDKAHRQRRAAVTIFCQEPKSRKQIQEFLDLADRQFCMQSVIQPLVDEGILALTYPDNPTHVKQRYVATQRLSRDEIEEMENG